MNKFAIDNNTALLLIVDVQERLAAVMSDKQKVIANCLHLIEAAKLLDLPIIVTEQYPQGLGPTVSEIKNALPLYSPVEKIAFDCCKEPSFLENVSSVKRKKIILAGMETHICVLQTCLGLLQQDYSIHVVDDAVCSRAHHNYVTGTELMRDAGAVISCTETVLFQLLEKAGTDKFRKISQRIK